MTKGSFLSKWMRAGALILALVIFPSAILVSAQNTNTGAGTTAGQRTRDDDGFDWGWLGLLGLLGLTSLLRRRDTPDRDRDRR